MAALMAAGVPVEPKYIVCDRFHAEAGVRGLKRLLTLDDPPTAIFAASDSIALGVLGEVHRHGMSVPREISVVGFGGTHQVKESIPAPTSVAQPMLSTPSRTAGWTVAG
jgi:LacI family transcriptional regulator